MFQLTAARRRLGGLFPAACLSHGFNSQPPEGGWQMVFAQIVRHPAFQLTAARRRLDVICALDESSNTFQLTAARRRLAERGGKARTQIRFNSQPPEGGWQDEDTELSTCAWFQLTAARRRLEVFILYHTLEIPVSTHSRPKAAGSYRTSVLNSLLWFQLTAARRRLARIKSKAVSNSRFQLTAARRRLGKPPRR